MMEEFVSPYDSFETRFQTLTDIISSSSSIVFFGGAGVSTGSGIPDFRSANGLYNNIPEEFQEYSPEDLLSRSLLLKHPDVFFKFFRGNMDLRNYEPNSVHKYIATLEASGKKVGVITQNIDMLHEKAGTKNIAKIHGTINACHCDLCGKTYDGEYIFNSTEEVPHCNACNMGIIRPNVVLYGETLPAGEYTKAVNMVQNADTLIVCGTSLTVYPAANLVSDFRGRFLIIINQSPTDYDFYSNICFREDMNMIFEKLFKEVNTV